MANLTWMFAEQHGDYESGFWAKSGGLSHAIGRWADDLDAQAVQQAIDDPSVRAQAHDLVSALRKADLDELETRVRALRDPDSLAQVDNPETLPDDLYGQWRTSVMPRHPGGLGVGLFDPVEGAAVSSRAGGSHRGGMFG